MSLKGFDKKWQDFPHYIIGITSEIWEGRNLASLRKYYDKDMIVRSPQGITHGNESVIADTMSTLSEFPDRKLYGEDVIWSGNDTEGNLLSSHRIVSTATHKGSGKFGSPSGKLVTFRTIADCAAKNNTIYDEWLVRDMGAIAASFGMSSKDYARKTIEQEGGFEQCAQPLTPHNNVVGSYTSKGNDNPWGMRYAELVTSIMNADLANIQHQYNRAVNACVPRNINIHGRSNIEHFWMGLRASFPSAIFSIDHVIGREDSNMAPRAALRWSLFGKHDGWGAWGSPSGAEVYILAISHAEFGKDNSVFNGIKREYILYDEVAIWKQIHFHKG